MYLMKAQTLASFKQDKRKAVKCYRAAIVYVSGIKDNQENMQLLMKNILGEAELCLRQFNSE